MTASPARRRMIAVAALVVATAIFAAAFWHRQAPRSPRLSWSQDPAAFSIALPYKGPRPWSFGAVPLCADKPGHIVIERLVPLDGNGGLHVLALATRPHLGTAAGVGETSFGDSQRDLVTEGFSAATPTVVRAVCPPDRNADYPGRLIFDELGVQVQRTGAADGYFSSVRLDYRSNGHLQHLVIPWGLKLCGPAHTTNESCPPPPMP